MKKLMILVCLLAAVAANAQTRSCCSSSSTKVFAMLGSDKSFKASHLSPLPFNFTPASGKMVNYNTPDGSNVNAFVVMADKPTSNYLFVIHEWWGLNDYIKQEAERLQKELVNVNVIALDLYDGKVGTNADEAGKLMASVKEERARAIINGAIAYAGSSAHIATIGWCFGGGWSLQTALMGGKQTVACVMYYGMPEKDLKKLSGLHSDVLGIFATKDAWINPQVVKDFEADMKKADKKLTVKNFDADHAFANPSNPKYNKEAAEQAHKEALAYLKARLK